MIIKVKNSNPQITKKVNALSVRFYFDERRRFKSKIILPKAVCLIKIQFRDYFLEKTGAPEYYSLINNERSPYGYCNTRRSIHHAE
jgi:hypothetical protein